MCDAGSSIPAGDFKGTVRDIRQITDTVFSIRIACPVISRLARPGQFIMIRFPDRSDPLLGRPLAVSSSEGDDVSICFQVVGRMTALLSRILPGEVLSLRGPMGNGFGLPSSTRVTMVAGALGAAPLIFAYNTMPQEIGKDFILGVADCSWYPFCEWIKKLVPEVRFFSEDGSIGKKGTVLNGLGEELSPEEEIWTCGPLPMMKAIGQKYTRGRERIRVSLETRMACGMGGCQGCVINTRKGKKRVCVDGPVFSAEEVCWDDLKG